MKTYSMTYKAVHASYSMREHKATHLTVSLIFKGILATRMVILATKFLNSVQKKIITCRPWVHSSCGHKDNTISINF